MLNRINKLLLLIINLVLIVLLCGCSDMGNGYDRGDADPDDFEALYADYYTTFKNVILMPQNKLLFQRNYKNTFFNEYTVEHLDWEKTEYSYDYNEYIYFAIKPEKAKKFTEFSIYVRGLDNNDENLDSTELLVAAYKVDSLLETAQIPAYLDIFEPNQTYLFSSLDNSVGYNTITVSEGSWNSKVIEISDGENDYVEIDTNEYLLIVFYNNTLFGKNMDLTEVSFQATNILICATK